MTATQAAQEYIKRQDRTAHPAGKFDNVGRWYPSDGEKCNCCKSVRSPSRAWPYSYMVHCRTAEHVAHIYNVDVKDVRREARRIRKEQEAQAA